MRDDPSEKLNDTPFVSVGKVHDELEDADDDELIRLLYAYDSEETEETEIGGLTSWAYVTFALRERGYVVDEGSDGTVEVRTTDGDVIEPGDVQEDPCGC